MDTNGNDKRELLKLKQGLISEEETSLEVEKKPVYEKPTGKAAVANFYYHNKIYIWLTVFFLSVGSVFVYFALTEKKPDVTVLFLADTIDASVFFFAEEQQMQRAISFLTFTGVLTKE